MAKDFDSAIAFQRRPNESRCDGGVQRTLALDQRPWFNSRCQGSASLVVGNLPRNVWELIPFCYMAVRQSPCTPGEHQNSWCLWMFIHLKIVLIGIDPYPYC